MRTVLAPIPLILLGSLAASAEAAPPPPPVSEIIQAKVLRAQPQYSRVETPRQVCEDEYRSATAEGDRGIGGSIIGGIAGAALGSRFGNGKGRDAATVAGAIGGAIVGDRVQNSDRDREAAPRRSCHTEYDAREVVTGYRITYLLNGKEYSTTTRRDPGERLDLRVTPLE